MRYQVLYPLLILSCSLLACKKTINSSGPDESARLTAGSSYPQSIALADVSDACLNLSRLGQAIRHLDPELQTLKATTDFQMQSPDHLRKEFRLSIAYSVFQFRWQPISELTDFDLIRQDNCETLTLSSSQTTELQYKITRSSPDSLLAEAEDGSNIEIHLLSPTSIRATSRFQAHDIGCSDKSAAVTLTRVVDWSTRSSDAIPAGDALYVSRDYLEEVADSVNRNIEDAYASAESSDGALLSMERLIELGQLPIRPGILVCTPLDNNGGLHGIL